MTFTPSTITRLWSLSLPRENILTIPPLPPDCLTDRPGIFLSSSWTSLAPDFLMSYSVITVADPPNWENKISELEILGFEKVKSDADS